jgi:hypothetical protein
MNTETENTVETNRTVETAAGPIIAPTQWVSLIKPGTHHATVIGAAMKRNHNGKLHLALDCDTGTRIINHEMYVSTPAAAANTAKQIKNAFGIESFKDVPKIVGQKCGLRIEHEEYNGRIQAKVRYVNPDNSTEAEDEDLAGLDAAFTAPANPTSTADVEF